MWSSRSFTTPRAAIFSDTKRIDFPCQTAFAMMFGDGLRLSCAGRPLNHEAGPGGRVNHGAHLRGVGIGHEHRRLELDLRMIDVVHRGERIQVSDRRVAVDLLKQKVSFRPYRGWPTLRVEVGPHRLPRERENPDR